MAKKHRKPHRPEVWVDLGPDTPAQRRGTVLEPAVHRGVAVRRRKREHALESLHRLPHGNPNRISERQMRAGLELHHRWCATQLSAYSEIKVDKTPDPTAAAVLQAQRVYDYEALSRHIPRASRATVEHVARDGRAIRDGLARNGMDASMHSALLKVALDILANELGY